MDGNGRWANERSSPRFLGHKRGVDRVSEIVEAAGELGVEALTLYAFSEENWSRPRREIDFLMELLNFYLLNERAKLQRNNVRLNLIGQIAKLPLKSQRLLRNLQNFLSGNSGMILTLALSYGSQQELANACQNIAMNCVEGRMRWEDIDAQAVSEAMETSTLPPLDFLIRTSGEKRLSNFLLWQAAYAELYFTDVYWPDFSKEQLLSALSEYASRNRRYGGVASELTRAPEVKKASDARC